MQYLGLSNLASHNEPRWRRSLTIRRPHSPFAKDWLLHQGSLTKKLKRCSKGDFRVVVLSQGIRAVRFSERRALALSTRRRALVREVALWVNGSAWVYARTVIPLSTLKGRLRFLQHLGNRPLGEQLFANPTMRRQATLFATMAQQHLPLALKHSRPLAGRRTLFTLADKPLLVCEVFLEAIYASNGEDTWCKYQCGSY